MNIKIYNTPSPLTVTELYKQPAIGYPESLKIGLRLSAPSICGIFYARITADENLIYINKGQSFRPAFSESATSQICVAF